jgi:hypothetical protein
MEDVFLSIPGVRRAYPLQVIYLGSLMCSVRTVPSGHQYGVHIVDLKVVQALHIRGP